MRGREASWALGGVAAAAVTLAGYAVALIVAGSSSAETGAIDGSVGPGAVISITPTGPFAAGAYTFNVDDMAPDHNFHLMGPGVDLATGVETEGATSWAITLAPGDYQFFCDPHASFMNGSFTVTAPATTSATSTTATSTTGATSTATTTTATTTTGTTTTETTTTTTATTTATTTTLARPAAARLASWGVRSTSGPAGRRIIVRIRVTAGATARLRLLRRNAVLTGVRRKVGRGASTLALRVPRRVRPGRYTLELRLVGPDGVARSYLRPVRVGS